MRVRLLGPVEVDSAPAQPAPRDRVVLAALAVRRGQPIDAEGLADALWPAGRPASWTKVIHGCISRLRTCLGPGAIETTDRGYRLVPGRVELDRDEFESLVDDARQHLLSQAPERAVAALDRAFGLWRGAPLTELVDWVPGRLEAARLEEVRHAAQEDRLQAELDAGRHHEAVSEAVVLAGEQPWRERRWELLALAQYRCGRQRDALASIRTARRALGSELGLDPGSGLVALERAILTQDPSLAADHDARAASGDCPWMGLVPYDGENRDTFFGRQEDVDQCLERLSEHPLLVLVGPSGCGKSSLMRAGLVPALRARGHAVAVLSPGADPLGALAAARAEVGEDGVLCIDQCEELFAGSLKHADVGSWLDQVAAFAGCGLVVLTLRSDHVAGLVASPAVATLAERGVHLVAPLVGERLRATVEGPARVAGLHLESGLVDLLLRDAASEPGALPLLSHALAETWQRREGTLLTVGGYRSSGGISGAVAASADRLYESLTDDGRSQVRWLMLRMAGLSEHGEAVRAPVDRATVGDDAERTRVVDLMVRARLLTTTGGAVELAHESLVRAWPRLRTWLEEDREGQRRWRHLAQSAAEWDRLGRPDSELYTGVRLAAAREWAARPDAQPTSLERSFLEASIGHADAERTELERQARRERTQNRRLRILLAGVAAGLVGALVAGLVAVDRGRTAAVERDAAREARTLAAHEALVSRSLTLRTTNRSAAALLAVEAWRGRRDPLSESALLGTFTDAPGFMGHLPLPYEVSQGATIPGTSEAVIASGERLHVVDLDTGELGPAFERVVRPNTNQQVLRVSGDGTRVAQLVFNPATVDDCGFPEQIEATNGRACTLLTVFDIASGRALFGPVPTPFSGGDLALNHAGRIAAVTGGFNGDLATYDVDEATRLAVLPGLPRPEGAYNWRDTGAVTFDHSGRLYLGSMNGPLRVVDARTLKVQRTYPTPPFSTHNFVSVTRGGLVVGTGDDQIVALDRRTGRERWTVDLRDDPDLWPCAAAAVAPAMDRLYCGSLFGEVEERSLVDGQVTGIRRDPQFGEVGDLAVSRGNELVSFQYGIHRWRLDGSGPIARIVAPGASAMAGYDDTGRLLDTVPLGGFGPHRIIDVRTGDEVARVDVEAGALWAGGRVLALLEEEGIRLADASSGGPRVPLSPVRRGDWVFRGEDESVAWVSVPRSQGRFALREFSTVSGDLTGRAVDVPGAPVAVTLTDAGRQMLVRYDLPNSHIVYGQRTRLRAALFDLAGGHGRSVRAYGGVVSATDGGIGRIVVADDLGQMVELDPGTMTPTAVLPGSVGTIREMSFSTDGDRLLTSGGSNAARLYDSEDWTRVGSIPAETAMNFPEAFLRPDGEAVAANGRFGVVEWDLDPDRMAQAACRLAGRNLTVAEWQTYFGDDAYRRTCPQFPAGS
ncbi:hypothetical protein GCM10009623_15710 [Nocardioides aestuarii]|uniref:BTAD domain-containing putative transcriptional regulator n=1 Tax=Nocardioides aestuarii TaxID=252231 RepID=A0ABW4TJ77_9ACTN